MADLKISELSALTGANLAAADELAIVDNSASETKKITVSDLIDSGVDLISAGGIPGAKILFGSAEIAGSALANNAVTATQLADNAVTAAKIADEATVDLVTTLPGSGAFTGQIALDTDDNKIYIWDGSAWQSVKGAGSVNTIVGSSSGLVNINISTSGDQVTITPTLDNTTSAAHFLGGPTGAGGAVAYRAIAGTDLPAATTSTKGGVVVNGNGLVMSGNEIHVDNTVTANTTEFQLTQYDANGLVTGGRLVTASDMPEAAASTRGAVFPGSGLTVASGGELNHTNSITPGTFTKVTVDAQGHVSSATNIAAADVPELDASKTTTGAFPAARIQNSSIDGSKLADSSVTKFGGAGATDNVVTFPTADFKGQFFYDEKNEDLYVHTGNSFVPITVISGNLILAGIYDASTNLLESVTTAGSAAGFTASSALPAPAVTNLNYYVVVSISGTGSGAAPGVSLAPPDMLVSLGTGTTFSLVDVSNAIAGQTASNISVTPAGNIAATDVQAALQELDTEKVGSASPTFTGNVTIDTNGTIVFEGSAADEYETTLSVVNPNADRTILLPNSSGTLLTTGDTGSVTSAMIADGAILNADINASAAIAVSKLGFGAAAHQLVQTNSSGNGVEFTSNVDVPGTLDVTGVATFDSTSTFAGIATFNANIVMEGTSVDANELTLTCNPTSDVTVTLPDATTTIAGLAVAQSFTKAQRGAVTALTDAATIAVDLSLSNNFSVQLGGNRTLGDPTNVTAGQSGVIVVTQDGTGSRTLAYAGTKYKFAGAVAPVLTTTGGAVDVLAYYCESATRITVTSLLNVS